VPKIIKIELDLKKLLGTKMVQFFDSHGISGYGHVGTRGEHGKLNTLLCLCSSLFAYLCPLDVKSNGLFVLLRSTVSFTCRSTSRTIKLKPRDSYIARLTGTKSDQPRFTIIKVAVDRQESMVLQR